MIRILFLTIFISLFVSFENFAKKKPVFPNSENPQTETDTLRNPNHFYYLSDLPLKKVGDLMLLDSILPSDNFITFSLMAAISDCHQNDLKFFLAVFEKVMNKADGALAEVVGSYTWNFIKKRPQEFINHIEVIKITQIRKWASFTFYEMYFAYTEEELTTKCQELIIGLKKIRKTKSLYAFENELNEIIINGL